jgi:uncharacterized protein (DUF952 family)
MTTSPDDIFRLLQFTMAQEKNDDIFHLVEVAVWKECKNADVPSKIDYLPATYEADGFIHATGEANMLLNVANMFFKSAEGDFTVLRIRPALLKSPVKWEVVDPKDETVKYPHIYGPMNIDSVVQEYAVKRGDDGEFLKVVGL